MTLAHEGQSAAAPGPPWPDTAAATLREQLDRLEAFGQLQHVDVVTDPRFEVAAVAQRASRGGPALRFRQIKGHQLDVVLGTDATRERIGLTLGVPPSEVASRYLEALTSPIAPVVQASGPVKEVVRIGDDVDVLSELPVLTHFEHDGGPYITSGIVVAEDPETGVRNVSYHRMQVCGPTDLRIVIVPRHLHAMQQKAEERGEALPVAVVLGVDSAVRLAAGTSGSVIPLGFDELAIAGALKGRPEQMVRCETSDVHVPANAEIVIEGEILPGVRADEGPFAEFAGTYKPVAKKHVFRATAMTRRKDAIYQGLVTGTSEQLLLMGLPNEPVMTKAIRGVVPGVRDVHVTSGGLHKFHAIVSLEQRHAGDSKDAIIAAFASHRDVKLVTVVDHDVDPYDLDDVERAVAINFQAARDLVLVDGGKGNPVDHSLRAGGTTSRMGIDATRSFGDSSQRHVRAVIPGASEISLAHYLDD
ncbi:MAG TPA: UbiD family decarboxylase [Actinomycetales bacterium]|nr:UbiD family decarboxylase [Actinomycetales bacterium]